MSRSTLFLVVLAVLVMLGFTLAEAQFSDRWSGSNISAEDFSELLKRVPTDIGDWHSTENQTSDESRVGAGAVGHFVSRSYRNSSTGEVVSVWIIVGHSRDICRHTPDVCFPSSGFRAVGKENLPYTIEVDENHKADFWSNAFIKEDSATGRHLVRVFWSWYKPNDEDKIAWEAPLRQRFHFGNTPALYKMYFSSEQSDMSETVDKSVCVRFAKEFIPAVDRALSGEMPEQGDAETESEDMPKTDAA
jgi:hypothetical protein